jgi:hypothetical protein
VNVELVAEVTEKGAILPDGKALMTVEQAKAFITERLRNLEMTVAERVSAALLRHDQLNYDLKEYHRVDGLRAQNQESLNARLAKIEKMLGIEPFAVDPAHRPGSYGNWKLTAQINRKPRPRAPRSMSYPETLKPTQEEQGRAPSVLPAKVST